MLEYPSFTTLALATIYVTLGSGRVILTRMSANESHKYDYLPVTVNVCAEAVKLIVCLCLMLRMELNGTPMLKEVFRLSWLEILKWSVPGLLYFLDNLIGFYVMMFFEPAVAILLANFGIISTSLLFRVILKRKFTRVQWASMLVLFLAIVSLSNQHQKTAMHTHRLASTLESVDNTTLYDVTDPHSHHNPSTSRDVETPDTSTPTKDAYSFHANFGHVFVIVQCFLSSLANVYNEKIFKEGNNFQESIYIQNTRLYVFGVIFNTLTLIIIPHFRKRIIYRGFFSGYNTYAALLIFNTALLGLTISLILKFRDNMFHVHSVQVTMVTVITLSMWLTGFRPTLDFFLLMPTVFLAIYIYNNSYPSAAEQHVNGGGRRRHTSENSREMDGHRKRGPSITESLLSDDEQS